MSSVTSIQTARTLAAAVPDVETFPEGTLYRLAAVAMALQGAAQLFNEIATGDETSSGVAGILDLAVSELTRMVNDDQEALSNA